MDCVKAREYLHFYIDDALSAKTRRELEQHLLLCPDCAAELEALRSLSKALRALPQEELPPGFSQALHEKLAAEPLPPQPSLWQRGWVRPVAAAACLVLLLGALAAGGNALISKSYNYSGDATAPQATPATSTAAPMELKMDADSAEYERDSYDGEIAIYDAATQEEALMIANEEPAATPAETSPLAGGGTEQQMERKIIRDASLSLRVDDFAAAYQLLNEMAARYGGYVVSSDAYAYDGEQMQRGYVTLRVDANRLDEALAEIESMGKAENKSVYTQDITMAYYDIAGRLTQYQTQEQRLMDIMRQAETVEDLIALESELTRVRAELESLTGQLRYYDQMTALSSINVNLYQPDSHTQSVQLSGWAGFMQDIREGFISGVNGVIRGLSHLAVGFFRLLPALLLLAVMVLIVVFIFIKKRKS